MKTRDWSYVVVAFFALALAGCTAASNPTSPANTAPPPASAETIPPAVTNTPAPGSTGTLDIKIQNFAFDPPSITIKVGTTVRWMNMDSATHTVTSDTGMWDSGGIASGDSYHQVFNTPGTYPYHCSVHQAMKGKIIVTS